MTGVVSPLLVSNVTKFMPLPPNSNNEPVLLPDKTGNGTNTIIVINARTYEPVTIDSKGSVKFMDPNANHSMTVLKNTLIQVGSFPKDKNKHISALVIHLL